MTSPLCVGIDLGTTNSVIAHYNDTNDTVEIIPNLNGDRLTPSAVLYLPASEILVGQQAFANAQSEEESPIISHVKRFIGLKQHQCQDFLDHMEYPIEIDHQGNPLIPVGSKKYKPEEISAQVLSYLKQSAEEYLGRKITEVVVTVPAYFNDSQRRATKDACTIAGMECLRLVPEPTAACLCYGLHKNSHETILVYDNGGGTTDCSILNLRDGIFEVVATSGDTQLGGADIDHLLVEFLQEKYCSIMKTQIPSPDITQQFAENIKKNLSSANSTTIRLGDFKYILTRSEFEHIIHDFVEASMAPVERVLADAKMTTADISQIVLVGGTTRIPLIQTKLKEMFGAKVPLNKSVNPDEAVAIGAAIQASILKNVGSRSRELLLLDVTPLSLGIETTGGLMNVVIKRQSSLPTECSKIYSTVDDNQESVDIKVFQGEREFTKDCISLGTFTLQGLPRRPRGVPKIKVTFKLNCDGLLEVDAVDKNTGLTSQITISSESNLTPEEVERLVADAEKCRNADQLRRQTLEEISRFEKYIYEIQRLVNLPEMKQVLADDVSPTNQYLLNTLDWIMANKETDLETIQTAKATVEFNLKPYLERMYSHQTELERSGVSVKQSMDKPTDTNVDDLVSDILNL